MLRLSVGFSATAAPIRQRSSTKVFLAHVEAVSIVYLRHPKTRDPSCEGADGVPNGYSVGEQTRAYHFRFVVTDNATDCLGRHERLDLRLYVLA